MSEKREEKKMRRDLEHINRETNPYRRKASRSKSRNKSSSKQHGNRGKNKAYKPKKNSGYKISKKAYNEKSRDLALLEMGYMPDGSWASRKQ